MAICVDHFEVEAEPTGNVVEHEQTYGVLGRCPICWRRVFRNMREARACKYGEPFTRYGVAEKLEQIQMAGFESTVALAFRPNKLKIK